MSRKIGRRIEVEESAPGRPGKFYWSGRWNRVSSVIDSWRECGEWWNGADEQDYFLVSADPGTGCYELCRAGQSEWELSRIID
ncbi:MAG: hypothetical protein BWY85_01886 [Firmicutes bacterium ADurb.Bin506]|jgi:hypothetical protein|nr:MAG: hypothetical protein BWY85_01886 [Firmicutes bacterium ADurb.Bin506]